MESPLNPRKVVVKVFDKLTCIGSDSKGGGGGSNGSKKHLVYQEGDEYIELQLKPGDAYEMDGPMQESYSHCVPKDRQHHPRDGNQKEKIVNNDDDIIGENVAKNDSNNDTITKRRICVVLRTGQQKYFEKDTGEACTDLSPRKGVTYHIGDIANLKEGSMYKRKELHDIGAFQVCSPYHISYFCVSFFFLLITHVRFLFIFACVFLLLRFCSCNVITVS